MPNFDLNNALDFAKLTNSSASGILSLFTGRGDSAWDIQEGSYEAQTGPLAGQKIFFHVFQSAEKYNGSLGTVTDSGGRRKVKFQFPYLDGQMTEDLGRTAETFEFDILLSGDNYAYGMNRLLQALNEPTPGQLLHPIRGVVSCVMESYQLIHKSDSRKAVAMRLIMVEHNFGGVNIRKQLNPSAPGALQKLTEAFKKIDNVLAHVEGVIFLARTVKNTIKNALSDYKNGFAKISGQMNATFNPGGSQIPALLPVNNGGVQNADGTFSTSAISNVTSPNDPFSSVPVEDINTAAGVALATEQIFKNIGTLRTQLSDTLDLMSSAGDSQGSLEFHDDMVTLKQTAIDMQDAFEKGKQSSQVKLIQYQVPHDMTIREVAFANGINIDSVSEIVELNPELESSNYIAQGTVLKVAVS